MLWHTKQDNPSSEPSTLSVMFPLFFAPLNNAIGS